VRIAFISFEFPPDTGHGGIATYLDQAIRMLSGGGHDVEVFAASQTRSGEELTPHALIHRIKVADYVEFTSSVAAVVGARHRHRAFDVVEAPEFQAEYRRLIQDLPSLPLVVKLHTPTFMIRRLMAEGWRYEQAPWKRAIWRLRNELQLTERRHLPDFEAEAIRAADIVSAPCMAIRDLVVSAWGVSCHRVEVLPLPFQPWDELLGVEAGGGTDILFLGRVEVRKGVVDLVDAVPHIRAAFPNVRIRFVGADGEAADGGASMVAYLKRRAGDCASALEFTGKVPRETLPRLFQSAAVVVLPSLWENFPLACLESMSAGRPVVVTRGTGMEEMVEGGRHGIVVRPRRPLDIAAAVIKLLRDDATRARMGQAARARVLSAYSWDQVRRPQIEQYERAIANHSRREVTLS